MKNIPLLIFAFFFVSVLNGQKKPIENQINPRTQKIINSQWTFNYFPSETADKGYESPGFNDSRWPAISLPHTWNSYETTGEISDFAGGNKENVNPYWWIGWGWYRKHFSISRDYSEQKVFIEFEGVQKYCKVWLNGKYLGDHTGGYGSFDFDITGYLKPGEDNVLAVAVSNLQKVDLEISPIAKGDYYASCGIYRDVSIVLKNKLFIPMQGSGNHEGGTFITTPIVSEKEAIVRIQTWVQNDNLQPRKCILQTTIANGDNQTVHVIKSEATINPGQLFMFDQTSKLIRNPHLWSTEDPYLYSVCSELIEGKEILDKYTSPLGFRWFRWDYKESLLYVNGKKMILTGENRCQLYPWLGNAIPKWITVMDFADMSENKKYNFIRTAFYPNDKLVYEMTDKHGIIVDVESPDLKFQDYSIDLHVPLVKEMIRRDRNHPSIMFRSCGNDTNHTVISKIAITEDTTRIVTPELIPGDSTVTYFKYTDKDIKPVAPTDSAGEPARIVLSGSHRRIAADKGSVVIFAAYVVDSKGNQVSDVTNDIRWSISGPGILVGPPVFVSDINKPDGMEKPYYIDMPVSNVIRSSGKPGRIHVSVFSSGLASGSFDITAAEVVYDNSIISEPLLEGEGRKPVTRSTLTLDRLDEVPMEINMTSDDFTLGSSDKNEYSMVIKKYILQNNPSIDSSSVEFSTLINLFGRHLLNNNGRLVDDDYNFNVNNYNNSRLISGYITSTKLPQLFKEYLKQYYANSIIWKGSMKNAGDEMNWLNWIPSGGVVVIVRNENDRSNLKGAVYTRHTGLPEIISAVYPQFIKFSDEAKERALIFISKMNPNVKVSSVIEGTLEENQEPVTTVSYTAEKGVPILIPEYKFISE